MEDIFRSFEGVFGGGSPFGRAGGPFGSPQRGQDFQVRSDKDPSICL